MFCKSLRLCGLFGPGDKNFYDKCDSPIPDNRICPSSNAIIEYSSVQTAAYGHIQASLHISNQNVNGKAISLGGYRFDAYGFRKHAFGYTVTNITYSLPENGMFYG